MLGSDYTMFLCFEMINLSDTRTNHSFAVFYDLHPTMNYENIQDENLILTSRFLLYETLDVIKKRAVLVIIGIIHTESRHNGDQPETDCFGFSCHVLTPLTLLLTLHHSVGGRNVIYQAHSVQKLHLKTTTAMCFSTNLVKAAPVKPQTSASTL